MCEYQLMLTILKDATDSAWTVDADRLLPRMLTDDQSQVSNDTSYNCHGPGTFGLEISFLQFLLLHHFP